MKKIGLVIAAITSLLLSMSTAVFAAGTLMVTFDGSSEMKYEGAEQFAENFSDMYPGESRTQEIIICNQDDREAEFFLQSQVLQAFEESVEASGAAYNISLKLSAQEDSYVIYGGTEEDESARIGGDEEGLKNLNGSLGDGEWIYLTELAPGEEAVLEMMVALDGESNTNDYMEAIGTFEFVFGAEYPEEAPKAEPQIIPHYVKGDPTYVTKEVKGADTVTRVIQRVKTGDTAPILAFAAAAGAALAVILVLVAAGRKKDRKADDL